MTSIGNHTQPLLGEALGFVDDVFFTATHYYHSSSTLTRLVTTVLLVWFTALLLSPRRPRVPGAKLHGFKGWWEPTFFLKTRFIYDAQSIINSGYAKVRVRSKRPVPSLVLRLSLLSFNTFSLTRPCRDSSKMSRLSFDDTISIFMSYP